MEYEPESCKGCSFQVKKGIEFMSYARPYDMIMETPEFVEYSCSQCKEVKIAYKEKTYDQKRVNKDK
jgi:hypothetical protein